MVRIVTLLIKVIAGNQGKVLIPGMSFVSETRRVDTSGRGRVLASLLSVFTTLLLFLLFLSFLVRSVAVFGLREI